jgi:hypothetical protein
MEEQASRAIVSDVLRELGDEHRTRPIDGQAAATQCSLAAIPL